ncbi:Subtilase family protein [Streptomyces sp. Ncost-T6T-2b]|nr:Subtilase family protein [Streptomyces sp. Ncost-T6T-2b]
MTKESPSSIPGARRAARIAAAAGLVAALTATGAAPVFAVGDPAPAPVKPAATSDRGDKLGKADADVLAKAEAKGEKNITMMVATTPGATEQVSKQLDAVEGSVLGKTYDKLGYVRATVPTKSAESTIKAASKLSSVLGIDLKQEIKLDDPTPKGDRAAGAKQTKATGSYAAPNKKTPAKNPYNPSFETGAVDFVAKNPKADGRGITIGILDSGVDLGHPALKKTTTGERKIVDWVTATDPVSDGTAPGCG